MTISQETIKFLETLQINPNNRNSIEYAKARAVIETTLKCRADKRIAKMLVIDHLKGEIVHPENHRHHTLPNFVQFPDTTKARF